MTRPNAWLDDIVPERKALSDVAIRLTCISYAFPRLDQGRSHEVLDAMFEILTTPAT